MAKAPADLRSLARAHTELGIQTLAGIARNSTSDAARVAAVGMLLERGWGKPEQMHTGPDGGAIEVTIRHIVENPNDPSTLLETAKVIDGELVDDSDRDL